MLEILDGGMIFELNKLYSDLGQTALTKNPEIIASIYQKYIDMGCHYITSCNYGFKSLKLDNWAELVEKAVDLCFRLKNKNYSKNTKLLGSLPPYYESYYHGPVIPEFTNFYNQLVDIMDSKVDEYILETQVDIKHIDEILSILTKKSKKKVKISIYPSSNITGKNISTILEKYNNIDTIMVNCCSFAEVISYYLYQIVHLKLEEQEIK
jgi:S-methylmethionine-dependent homocysteine/selenocysteine methylase